MVASGPKYSDIDDFGCLKSFDLLIWVPGPAR